MAVSGGATVAYICKIVDGQLQRETTTRSNCMLPVPAFAALMRGETVIVAGGDITVTAELVEWALRCKGLEERVNSLKLCLMFGVLLVLVASMISVYVTQIMGF